MKWLNVGLMRLSSLIFQVIADPAGGRDVVAGDAQILEFGAQALDTFGEGGETEFVWIGEEKVGKLVGGNRSGRFFD